MGIEMTKVLGLGKVSREVFNRSVLPFIPVEKAIELDGATTNLSGNTVIAHSPSIGVPIEALGFFAFHYSASNVASKFGKPRHLISGIYLPLKTTEDELQTIVRSLGKEARKYDVTITAGQTATYYGLEIPLLTSTCLGDAVRTPDEVAVGDKVILVGEVGGEAVWLDELSKGEGSDIWKRFTPLPAILALQKVRGIKLMHDVSEGGVKGSLYEVATTNRHGLNVSSKGIALYPGAEKLQGDILRAPSYGTLIVISDSDSLKSITSTCSELDLPHAVIGEITSERGLVLDGVHVQEQERIDIDEIYGSFAQKDPLIDELHSALDRMLLIPGLVDLIPEVGTNIVFAKPEAKSSEDVAGLIGRVIKGSGKPLVCGEIAYDASKYLSSVLFEAMRLDPSKRAALNIRGGNDIADRLSALGLRVQVLPHKVEENKCPVTSHLESSNTLLDAYLHPGDMGIEATTTIIGENPKAIVDVLERMVDLEG
jgi:predicted fused transcriptional regulator/phosphomethylpyrimidine kinase/hydrogenase maturation factor